MTLQELITDLKAAGANENTIQLARNCYDLGRDEATESANRSWTLMCKKMVEAEREAIYHIVCHAPFEEAADDDELESEVGDAMKALAFRVCSAIRTRGKQ